MSHSPIVPLSPRPQVESGWLPPPRSSSFNRSEYRNIASPSPFPFPLLQFLRGGRNIFVVRFFLGGQSDSIFTDSPLPFDSSPFDVLPLWNAAQRFLHPTPSLLVLRFFLLLLLFSPCHGSRCEKKRNEEGEKERKKEEGSKRRVEKRERFPLSWSESFFFFNFFSLRKESNPRMCKWFYERAFRAVRNAFVSQTFIFALQNRSHVLVKNTFIPSGRMLLNEWNPM